MLKPIMKNILVERALLKIGSFDVMTRILLMKWRIGFELINSLLNYPQAIISLLWYPISSLVPPSTLWKLMLFSQTKRNSKENRFGYHSKGRWFDLIIMKSFCSSMISTGCHLWEKKVVDDDPCVVRIEL